MTRPWRMLAPVLLGTLTFWVMLFVFGMVSRTDISAAQPTDQDEPPERAGLPAERAEMYRSLLLASFRTEPYLSPPQEVTVLRDLRLKLGHDLSTFSRAELQAAVDEYYAEFYRKNHKSSRANPLAYLGRLKAKEMAMIAGEQSIAALTGNPNVLTVMLNFTGVETYTTDHAVAYHTQCLTDTTVFTPGFQVIIDGPHFNEIPQPSDNFTPWLDPATSPTGGFTREYFELLMYSTTGDTNPMRPELPNPWDGGNGFDFSGVSFRNYFDENSRGLYIPQGEVVDVAIREAVSYFGAARCNGAYQDDGFNEIPSYTIAISAAQQINAQYPGADTSVNSDFSWADWDQEDVFDYDNDGNFLEPDGYVDHFFLIEPGEHDGGEYGQFLIWPHSADVNPAAFGTGPSGNPLGGYQVALNGAHPLGSIWILNYTVSNETGGLGVLVHEYGHDIGLPDNYGIDGSGANPGFWDLMADGTFGGGVRSMHPTHLTIWDKEFLGWNAPVEIDLTGISASGEANTADFMIGQQSKPPTGTIDGLRINLPDVTTFASVIAFDDHMWWSDKGDDRNESIARNVNLQAGETATVTAQMAYFIEEGYDFFYWEISSTMTGGWIPLEVYSGTTLLTTDDNPYGTNLSGNGINGFSTNSDWVQATATITPGAHAGGAISFRFRYFTDTGFQEEGIYLDNISVSGNMSGLIFTDDAEGGDTWTHLSESSNKNKPWLISDGTRTRKHYYLVEWRNSGEATGATGTSNTAKAFDIAGFDIGLNRAYWISQFDDNFSAVKYDPFFLHTPGMVVWYVNNSYDNNLGSFLFDPPSLGAKGSVLAVDANPYPFIFEDPTLGELVLWERHGSFDAAYTLIDRPAFKLISDFANTGSPLTTLIPGAKAKSVFHDRIGVAPGLFGEPPDNAFFFESDSGVVLPTVNNVPYHPAWDFIGGTGNPGLEAFGINLEVLDQADDGTWGQVRFWLDDDTLFFDKTASNETVIVGQLVTYTLTVKDATGTRYDDNFSYTYSATMTDNLPPFVTYVPGSLSITDGPWTTTPSTATIAGDMITWHGTLGGNPLHVPDAVIQYTVVVSPSTTSGALASSAALHIEQILISTDTFNNPLPVPYFWPKQTAYFASSQIKVEGEANGHIYLPSIHE